MGPDGEKRNQIIFNNNLAKIIFHPFSFKLCSGCSCYCSLDILYRFSNWIWWGFSNVLKKHRNALKNIPTHNWILFHIFCSNSPCQGKGGGVAFRSREIYYFYYYCNCLVSHIEIMFIQWILYIAYNLCMSVWYSAATIRRRRWS